MRRGRRIGKLAPSTAALYARTLKRVYGDRAPDFVPDLDSSADPMPETVRAVLCAAIVDYWKRRGETTRGEQIAEQIPEGEYIERTKIFPSPEEIERFVGAAKQLPPRVVPIVRVMLGLGFRGEEMLMLERGDYERALATGKIAVLGKGSKERELPTDKATAAIKALLAARPRDGNPWEIVGDLLGRRGSTFSSRRNMLARYVLQAARRAELAPPPPSTDTAGWTPHRLRHVFATRMSMAGAPDAVVAAALGHGGSVTRRYLHPDASTILQYMRET
jgi:integrase